MRCPPPNRPSVRACIVLLVVLLLSDLIFLALAQVGRYPPGGYPPGGYPPGRSPRGGIGGPGLPIPRRSKQKKPAPAKEAPEPLLTVTGILRRIDDTSVVLEAQDTRLLNLKRVESTKFYKNAEETKPSELKPGDHLMIEAKQDVEGYLFAVNVIFQKGGTPEERASAAEPVEVLPQGSAHDDEAPVLRRKDSPVAPEERPVVTQPPPPKQPAPPVADEDDEGPPILRRRKPGERPVSRPVAEARFPPAPPEPGRGPDPAPAARIEAVRDPAIEKARAAAVSFTETLPNYICRQLVARFVNTSHIVNWQPVDVVSAEVIYEKGRERYRNVAINGKPTGKGMQELPGAWSTGEFGTVLADLFSPATAADFQFRKEAAAAGQPALVYDFSVERQNSHWRVLVPSQTVVPAYRGSVWIDKRTARVLRIEMQARGLPLEFPLDKVESATDYQYVRFGGEAQFLVPVHAETLSCQRGTSLCSRNTIDFRNYQKYSSESSITFEK